MSVDKYSNVKVDEYVKLKVCDIDRAKTDPKNIVTVVVDINDNQFYQLSTKIRALKQYYTQNQLLKIKKSWKIVVG